MRTENALHRPAPADDLLEAVAELEIPLGDDVLLLEPPGGQTPADDDLQLLDVQAVGDAFRFLEHDRHELLLFGAQRELLLQDLDRARNGGQGIADLVSQAGRNSAGLGQALPDEKLPLGRPERFPRPAQTLGQLAHQSGDDEEDAPSDEDGDEHRSQGRLDDMFGAEGGNETEVQPVGEDAEEDGRQGRGQEAGPAGDDQARGHDREEVGEVHRGRQPARDVDEGRDEKEVEDDLGVGLSDRAALSVQAKMAEKP